MCPNKEAVYDMHLKNNCNINNVVFFKCSGGIVSIQLLKNKTQLENGKVQENQTRQMDRQ